MRNVHTWRAWYLFSRDHDIIEIGPEFLEQKGNVLPVLSLQVRYVQLKLLYNLTIFGGVHMRKNTRLSPPAQLQFCVPERRSLGTRLSFDGICKH